MNKVKHKRSFRTDYLMTSTTLAAACFSTISFFAFKCVQIFFFGCFHTKHIFCVFLCPQRSIHNRMQPYIVPLADRKREKWNAETRRI